MGFRDGSGISWTICKQSAPRSIYTGRMLFLTPNQQCQSTESQKYIKRWSKKEDEVTKLEITKLNPQTSYYYHCQITALH